ncbi:choice-of-anchor M domain-containing protein [Luteolibacter ambystomatis]|uniref:Choice-of-anchor M domain-containing protein n=1 Tax=Luteolibacter ambystomatis TaxID=2824561 RepID=A0A975G5T3_9BACT|nr:choice-of-anchor M domain-containing protein [Luteolibacter ambystomatis]QUE49286.1 choice-of-anchor M domain-containing protein [Luteolibacter ambystomatis]
MRLIFALTALAVPSAKAATPPADLLYGHFEFHLGYVPTPGNPDAGWRITASYDQDDDFSTADGVVVMDPSSTVFTAAPSTLTAVPSPPRSFARFGPAGTPLWILPQNNTLGRLFLGVRATIPTGIFQASVGGNYTPSPQGSISLRLISVTGTGPAAGGQFATWKTESLNTQVFSFDTTDGITDADKIDTIPVSSHTHYNWGFTKPGTYDVTVEAKGKLMAAPTSITSGRATYRFSVPFTSRAANGSSIRVVADAMGKPRMVVGSSSEPVAYAPDQVMLEAGTATGASSALPGALWEVNGTLSTLAAGFPNGVGVDPVTASRALSGSEWSGVSLEIGKVRGPGNFALIEGGTVLAGNSGGTIPLNPAAARNIMAGFTASGLYVAECLVHGVRNGLPVSSGPLRLFFGAGLTANHTYADWQSSFERTAGISSGALASAADDFDHDGVANGVEFALFWHGMDPTRPDSSLGPLPFPDADGYARYEFLRDTYKDPLNETGWQIRPSYSPDLVTWRLRSSRTAGFPFTDAETGAGEGNAAGRITRRRLRIMPGPFDRMFYRMNIKSF